MTLLEIIRKKKFATATVATVATDKPVFVPSVAKVASVAVANSPDEKITQIEIDLIRAWLYKIGEPPEDHHLVTHKCSNDPDALLYFLRHARGEYEPNTKRSN
ncbi:MAG: hypothetical protein H0W85_09650 [Methylotenera sp.]|nr:hypothetical protein [Methylotenera sp.]